MTINPFVFARTLNGNGGPALSVESPQRHHLGISACHRAAWTAPRRAAVEMFPRVCPRARARSLARRPNPSTQP
jgi:hypothetical protein